MKFNSQLNTSGREPTTCDTPVSHSIDIPTEELKKAEKESGYAICALLPKKDERYRRRGIKVEPKWLGMGERVIFRTLKLEKFLGRSHYKESFHQDHIPSYI